MSIPITIEIELMGDGLHERSRADVERAIKLGAFKAAQFAKGLWIRRAQMLDIRRTGEYIRGIQANGQIIQRAARSGGQSLSVEIDVVNTAPHASIVEDGHGAFSMPAAIDWSGPKVKQGAKGPYLHIPFRHTSYQNEEERTASGTTRGAMAAMMPEQIYNEARRLPFRQPGAPGNRSLSRPRTGPSITMGTSSMGADRSFIEHRSARTVGRDSQGNTLRNPAWRNSKYDRLFRSGRPGHSQYMTIRTITPRSLGWRIPAMHGHGVARQVAYALSRGTANRMVTEIVERGILEALGEEYRR